MRQKLKITFNGLHKSYENCDSYLFRKKEVLVDKPKFLRFAVLQVSEILFYHTYFDKLQPYFGQEKIELNYMDTDSFVLSMKTENFIEDLKNLEDMFDFSKIDKKDELFSNKNKKVNGKFNIETPKVIWKNELVCLTSNMYSFRCGVDFKNKLKGGSKSQSEQFKFEGIKKCLDGEEYQGERNNYALQSINHEMYPQEVKKSILSILDDKRNFSINNKSLPWN